jgi:hypothetical protein
MIEGSGFGSIPLTNGFGSGYIRVATRTYVPPYEEVQKHVAPADPDPDSDPDPEHWK